MAAYTTVQGFRKRPSTGVLTGRPIPFFQQSS